jgi:glycosyltransferase involved in cell wall biosynthesis
LKIAGISHEFISEREVVLEESNGISVVLVAYNAISTVTSALDSLLVQTKVPDEIVFVDDCSSDGTFELVSQWSNKLQSTSMKLIRNPINLGAAASRNIGVQACSGCYVIFCDSDDLMCRNRVARQFEALQGSAVSYVSSIKFYPNQYKTTHINSNYTGLLPFDTALKKFLLGAEVDVDIFVPSCTLGVRRKEFWEVEGFDSSLVRLEDVDFALRASRKGFRFDFDEEILVRRTATSANYKSREVEALAQESLLDRYRTYLNPSEYREISTWHRVRRVYFSGKRLALIPALTRYLLVSRSPGNRFRAALKRLNHDRMIREK